MIGRDEVMIEVEWYRQTWRRKELKHRRQKQHLTPRRSREGQRLEQKQTKGKRDSNGTDFTLASPCAVVWYKPSSARMRLGWAHLTGVTPCPSYCGTAQSLCAHNACELALTHLVIHRGKAWSSAVVCNSKAGFWLWQKLHLFLCFQYRCNA